MPPGTYYGGGEDENNLAFTSYYIVLHIMFFWSGILSHVQI